MEGRRRPRRVVAGRDELHACFNTWVGDCAERPQTPQDRKQAFRKLLSAMGGLSTDDMRTTFRNVLSACRPGESIRFYDLRGCTSTDMRAAGVDHLVRLYVTGHSLKGQILATYEGLDLDAGMRKYYDHIEPLLAAIEKRAAEVGFSHTLGS